VLAKNSSATITAVDNDASALSRLTERAKEAGVADRVANYCASMTNLPFEVESFDVIWSEGSAYIMGVTNAMKEWRCLLKENGVLVISDLVWHTSKPNAGALAFWQKEYPDMTTTAFWQKEYPDMTTTEVRVEQAEAAGYKVLDSFSLSEDAWKAYIDPLQARVDVLKFEMAESEALRDIETELEIYRKNLDEFGYQIFVLELKNN
jgi:SAM-dependent methyltransferase